MLTTVDFLCFYYHLYAHDNQLLKLKYAFNLEILIYFETQMS